MLYSLLSAGRSADFFTLLLIVFSYIVLVLVMLPFHEWAHAFTADRLGDSTPRWNGRLSLNPFHHLDVWGTIMIFVAGVGYARPVPVNPRNFRNPRRDMALTALAGPVSNLVLAAVSLIVFRVLTVVSDNYAFLRMAQIVLVYVFASVNIGLAVFNLLPVPPLDGFRIWSFILPSRWVYAMERYSRYITIAILILAFSGRLDWILDFFRHWIGAVLCLPLGLPNYF